MKITLPCIMIFLIACILQCTSQIAGGGGSETTSGITVSIKRNQVSGKAAPSSRVQLFWNTFNPLTEEHPDSLNAIADSSGNFNFNRISDGMYNLYSTYDSAEFFCRAVFIRSLSVPSDTTVKEFYLEPVKTIFLIKVPLYSPETQESFCLPQNLYFEGTPFVIDVDGRENIDRLPPGTYNCREFYLSPIKAGETLKYEAPDTITIPSVTTDTVNILIPLQLNQEGP